MNETLYIFSAAMNGFIPLAWKDERRNAGIWPEDATEITHEEYLEFTTAPPYGMTLGSKNGQPTWVAIPQLSRDEQIAITEVEKQKRIASANDYINNKQWPGKAAIGRLKGEDLAQYHLWLDYLDELEAVDASTASDIFWPEKPA